MQRNGYPRIDAKQRLNQILYRLLNLVFPVHSISQAAKHHAGVKRS